MSPVWKDPVADSNGIVKKLNKFFACIGIHCDRDSVNGWMGRESEEQPQMEVLGNCMLGQIDKLNINKFSAPDGVYTGVLKKHTPQIRIFWIANCV